MHFRCSYKIGDAYLHLGLEEAQKRLEKDAEQLEKEVSELNDKVDECHTSMKELKVVLYAKFGKNINLD
jgi:prefoldin subunit 4